MSKVLNVKIEEVGGIVVKSGELDDGTRVNFCNPHHKWEWDCKCGHVNGTRELFCGDCGRDR